MFPCLHLRLRIFIAPQGGRKIFVASLVDPFLVDRIIIHQRSSTDSTGKFRDVHGIQGCLWRFYVCRRKKYSDGFGIYYHSTFNRVFNAFLLPVKTTHLLYSIFSSSDLKHMMSFWWLFFIDLLFICGLGSVIWKKYTNTNGKTSVLMEEDLEGADLTVKEEVEGVGLSVEDGVEGVDLSIEEGVGSSSSIFSFILFMCVSYEFLPRSCLLGSFVNFCDVLSTFILRQKENDIPHIRFSTLNP